MGNNTNPCYVYLKGNTYYFTRHVPKDVREYYTSNRVVMCLKTQSRSLAVRAAKNISSKLDEYWLSLRLSQLDIPAAHLVRNQPQNPSQSLCKTLSEALGLYLRLKGGNKDKVFHRVATRNVESVIDVLGDRPLDEYKSSHYASRMSDRPFNAGSLFEALRKPAGQIYMALKIASISLPKF